MSLLGLSVSIVLIVLIHAGQRMLRNRQREKMSAQLMEALETVVSALRAGSSFFQAFAVAADDAEAPLRPEFERVLQEYRLGMPLEESLEHLAERVRIEEMNSLVASVRISQASGGSLASILQSLSRNLREQYHLKLRVGALAAQGKLQAVVMFLLPYCLLFMLHWMEPDLVRDFFRGPYGELILSVVFVAQGAALWFMQRILEVQV